MLINSGIAPTKILHSFGDLGQISSVSDVTDLEDCTPIDLYTMSIYQSLQNAARLDVLPIQTGASLEYPTQSRLQYFTGNVDHN
jgi:hypothetical protein